MGTKFDIMKTHTFTIDESNWIDSKYRTIEWERRVDIIRWEHNYETKQYIITIKIK
jgi:hypothetical protein